MKPKLTAIASAAALIGLSTGALADYDNRYGAQYDYAQVTSSQPIINYVTVSTPVRECWQETQHYTVERRGYDKHGSTLLGAVIGGVIGHQVGSGRGNDAATVAGTLIGAAIGNDARRDDRYVEHRSRPVQRCKTTHRERREQRIDGYRVTYKYHGQKYVTEMPYDPGKKIKVRVDIRPAA